MDQNEIIKDFYKLKDLFCRIEPFDMWSYDMHLSLAYLVERASRSSDYKLYYKNLVDLATKKNYNELAWEMCIGIKKLIDIDIYADYNDKANIQQQFINCKFYYTRGELCYYCFVDNKFAPEWFINEWNKYYNSDNARRKNGIISFCMQNCGVNMKQALAAYNKLCTQPDLLNEFFYYTKTKTFKTFYPAVAGDNMYTASQIFQAGTMTPLTAYMIMMQLRANPRATLEQAIASL